MISMDSISSLIDTSKNTAAANQASSLQSSLNSISSDSSEDELMQVCKDFESYFVEEVLKEMAAETRTIVMYEAPHRLVKTLKLLSERLGDRKVTVCRELTKRHETAFQSTLEGAVAYYEANDPKGECVIVIAGRSREEIRQEEKARWEDMSIEDHMEHYISQGLDRKEAMKKVAKDRGVQKREIYNYLEKQKS